MIGAFELLHSMHVGEVRPRTLFFGASGSASRVNTPVIVLYFRELFAYFETWMRFRVAFPIFTHYSGDTQLLNLYF